LVLKIEGEEKPESQQVTECLERLDKSREQIETGRTELLEAARNAEGAAGEDFLAQVEELRKQVQECRQDLGRLPKQVEEQSRELKERLASLLETVQQPLDLSQRLIGQLRGRQLAQAAASLDQLSRVSGSGKELGEALGKLFLARLIEQMETLAQRPDTQREVLALVRSLDRDKIRSSAVAAKAAAVLEAMVLRGLADRGACLVKPDGTPGDPSFHAWLAEAVELAVAWKPELAARDEVAYAKFAVEAAGRLTDEAIEGFIKSHPKHAAEIACWQGMGALKKENQEVAAGKHFRRALQCEDGKPYEALAKLGQAIALRRYRTTQTTEILARAHADRSVVNCFHVEGKSWSPAVQDAVLRALYPGQDARPAEVPSSAEFAWLDKLTVIAAPKEWEEWKRAGMPKMPIPWLKAGGNAKRAEEWKKDIIEFRNGGGLLIVDGPLFGVLTEIKLDSPGPALSGEAAPPKLSLNDQQKYPFLRISGVRFDVCDTQRLISGEEKPTKAFQPFLHVITGQGKWCVCAAHGYISIKTGDPWRSIVYFFPDHIEDTPDGRKFLKDFIDLAARFPGLEKPAAKSK
jgi:hypothetical protein